MSVLTVPFIRPYFPRAALTSATLEFWVGRDAQIDRVVRGLLASTDAHYLITGYPGVGKTSFVSRVIAEWRRLSARQGINRVLIFNLQLAHSQSTEEIVRRLIGKVYFGSLDGQFSPDRRLAERLQLNFIQAYSKTLKETQAETATTNRSGGATVKLPTVMSLPGGDLNFSRGRSNEAKRSIEIQREYNLSAVISDFEAVIHLLTKPESFKSKRFWPPFRRLFRRRAAATVSPRILFVVDQLNDLNDVQALTNLFSLPGASFLVLGGIKLKEQIAAELERGVHVLDNFQEEYLSCQWDQAGQILSLLISKTAMGAKRFAEYGDYLNFFAQGLPRRLFAAIDQHTNRSDSEFFLQLTDSDSVRVRLGARLHRVIWRNRKRILGDYIDSVRFHSRDKALRGVYHLADRIFRVTRFTFQEANTVATQISEAIIHSERQRVLKNLLKVLTDEGLLVSGGNTYSLAEDVLRLVSRIPDWLNDGFVDARELLEDVRNLDEEMTEHTGVLHVPTYVPEDTRGAPTERGGRGKRPPGGGPRREASGEDARILLGGYLGRYRVLQLLGRGGMGAVYLGEDEQLARRVALKVISTRDNHSANFNRRFLQEGRAIAMLDHPNIVSVHDIQELSTGEIVLVTAYVEGDSLGALIHERGRLKLRESVEIAAQVASALAAAHRMGVIHRDVKPSNIMIAKSGLVKLLDFGIAKIIDSARRPDMETTAPGLVIGTPGYASPEQLRGTTLDQRSDLYSLGMVLYEMLAGRPPYKGDSMAELISNALAAAPPPVSSINPSVSPELDAVVMKLLEKAPENRFSNASEVVDELEGFLRKNFPPGK
jgi:serine/threonine-protein kinase